MNRVPESQDRARYSYQLAGSGEVPCLETNPMNGIDIFEMMAKSDWMIRNVCAGCGDETGFFLLLHRFW